LLDKIEILVLINRMADRATLSYSKIDSKMSSSKSISKKEVKEADERQKYIASLEKYYRRYERKIKRNERALKKPYVLETPGFEGTAIPEDMGALWLRDIIVLDARENVRRTLPKHKQNLEQLDADVGKLRMGRPIDELSPYSRATIYSRKWSLGPDWKSVMSQSGGLWY
jgi:hypothetical protein